MNLLETGPEETTLETGGFVKGVAIGIVRQNRDPEGLCRVKVSFPWHAKPSESFWARLAVPMAGKDRGFVTIPEIDDEVLVAFEREDVRFPYILGALWNGKDKPPISNDDGKNDKRIFKSRKKHHLLFDDGARGVVELAHHKGRKVVFDDNGFAVQDENGNVVKVDSNSGRMTIESKGQLSIKAVTLSIEAATLEIKSQGTLTLKGAFVFIN